MHLSTAVFGAGLASVALAGYTVQDDYSGNNFFAMFGFDTVQIHLAFLGNPINGCCSLTTLLMAM